MNLLTDLTDAEKFCQGGGGGGNKLLIEWWLASVVGIWKQKERGFGH